MPTKKDWTVTGISLCIRTGGYTFRGRNNLDLDENGDARTFSWDMGWKELDKDHSRYDFSGAVWEGAAYDWAGKCGHKLPGMETALIVR